MNYKIPTYNNLSFYALTIFIFIFQTSFLVQPNNSEDIETVYFQGMNGNTELVAYLFKPEKPGNYPAVVMMHGRSGAYSLLANGIYNEKTVSKRHKAWGRFWAGRGYIALLVDSFGPRGYAGGFKKHSYKDRPPELNEVTIRPLDAYAALKYLRLRSDVIPDKIGLQGWSNGGSAALSAMAYNAQGINSAIAGGFRAALSFYPGCGLKGKYDNYYKPYAPLMIFVAANDEEVSPIKCAKLAERTESAGGNINLIIYDGAHHSFDSPAKKVQGIEANHLATIDAQERAEEFFRIHLQG